MPADVPDVEHRAGEAERDPDRAVLAGARVSVKRALEARIVAARAGQHKRLAVEISGRHRRDCRVISLMDTVRA